VGCGARGAVASRPATHTVASRAQNILFSGAIAARPGREKPMLTLDLYLAPHYIRAMVARAGAGIALAAAVLTMAGCSQALPLGPRPPAQHHLATTIVLQAVSSQAASLAGTCPAGSATLPPKALEFPGSAQCYRETGQPLTITSAAVGYLHQPAGHGQPANYGLSIQLPPAGRAALLTITTRAHRSRDSLAIIVAGKTWGVPLVETPFTSGQFEIPAQSASQALQLQRTLVPSA
jgi:hypothetical protein